MKLALASLHSLCRYKLTWTLVPQQLSTQFSCYRIRLTHTYTNSQTQTYTHTWTQAVKTNILSYEFVSCLCSFVLRNEERGFFSLRPPLVYNTTLFTVTLVDGLLQQELCKYKSILVPSLQECCSSGFLTAVWEARGLLVWHDFRHVWQVRPVLNSYTAGQACSKRE